VKYLLDTNALSEPVRRRPSPRLLERLSRLGAHCATSVLCVGEMLYGARRVSHGGRYEQYLREVVLPTLPVLAVDLEVATTYGELRAATERDGRPRADLDLLIAATALRHELVLVTHNVSDFADLPGLAVEDWTRS
jgi:tRNA(fMet)-specific endonuclease VapC